MTEPMPGESATVVEQEHGRVSGWYARTVVALRWWIAAGWVVVVVAVTSVLTIPAGPGGLAGFVPTDAPAIKTELASFVDFGFPLYSRTILVQHDADGLSPWTQAEAVLLAAGITQRAYADDIFPVIGALPLSNLVPGTPAATARGTTLITFLFTPPWVSFQEQQDKARLIASRFLTGQDDFVGVTGTVPARAEQARLIGDSLGTVEIATLLAILLIVGLTFRSVVAPLVTVAVNGIAVAITGPVAGFVASVFDVAVPDELRPLLIALQIGVVTDYVIFFFSGMRHRLAEGNDRRAAARLATVDFAHIVAAAGVIVAAGTSALFVAKSDLFRAFAPGMVLAILVGLVVAITLVPALMAIAGGILFWPSHPRPRPARRSADDTGAGGPVSAPAAVASRPRGLMGLPLRLLARKRSAAVLAVACTAVLAAMAVPLKDLGLGLSFIPALPPDIPAVRAADAAKEGFAPGITSPTEVLIEGSGVTGQRLALDRLQNLLEDQPGVAGVLGPKQNVTTVEAGVVLARSGEAARYLVVFSDDPLGAKGVRTATGLRENLDGLVAQAGLTGVTRAGMAGDTAIAETIVTGTREDLLRIAAAALLLNLVLLAGFLRSIIAPLYLLASSVLALLATLGLTAFVFQDLLGHDGLTFYVPFASAVLLVSLGSDYNVFSVGQVWNAARSRPLHEALLTALPQSARAITSAGFTLAVSFGLLALVPLQPFRELAFAMFVGILIDALVVRTLLVPALIVLVGPRSAWPGRLGPRTRRHPSEPAPAAPAPAPTAPATS